MRIYVRKFKQKYSSQVYCIQTTLNTRFALLSQLENRRHLCVCFDSAKSAAGEPDVYSLLLHFKDQHQVDISKVHTYFRANLQTFITENERERVLIFLLQNPVKNVYFYSWSELFNSGLISSNSGGGSLYRKTNISNHLKRKTNYPRSE